MIRKLLFLIALPLCWSLSAQRYSNYENPEFNPFLKDLYSKDASFHTSIRQYRLDEINKVMNADSVIFSQIRRPDKKMNFWRSIWHDDLLKYKSKSNDVFVRVNPLFNLELGKDNPSGRNTWTNTRGLFLEGQLGKHFAFYSDFHENQAVMPEYIDDFIVHREIVPGQGRVKYSDDFIKYQQEVLAGQETQNQYNMMRDYSQANGYLSVNLDKYFNIQLGQGKNFIGDGYRSMLLSDNTVGYPFLKFTTSFAFVKYQFLITQMDQYRMQNYNDERFTNKFMVSHYLDFIVKKRFTAGFFESVVWAAEDSLGNRGFDFNYLNPFIFLRPVEYKSGSPDNVNIGFNFRYLLMKHTTLYAQIMLDEFKLDEVTAGNQWWGNKQGYQVGMKVYDLFKINNLFVQLEYNMARPYLYTHYTPEQNYGHYNQELAHPLGANFKEVQSFLRYRYKRWYLQVQGMYAQYGDDYNKVENGVDINYGHNIFLPSETRASEYGNVVLQGEPNKVVMEHVSLSFLVNARNNFNLVVGMRNRDHVINGVTNNSKQIYFAVRTTLDNFYYDF